MVIVKFKREEKEKKKRKGRVGQRQTVTITTTSSPHVEEGIVAFPSLSRELVFLHQKSAHVSLKEHEATLLVDSCVADTNYLFQ